jgi:glutamyl-tRNA synthetase
MFARKHHGQFILRIEDTDQKRTTPHAVEVIMEGLRWLGLEWDEGPDIGGPYGPYVQTQRSRLYQQWATWLLAAGHVYKCFCTEAELAARRQAQQSSQGAWGYDRRCRYLTPAEIAENEAAGLSYTLRLKAPLEGNTVVHDLIRGDITFPNKQLDDQILLKSDGLPTYHLANVVDVHLMEITHILRADEWLSSAPLHIHLYAAFGWQPPLYAHLPVVLNPSGRGKLSKRTQAFDDDGQQVFVRVEEFQQVGYLPEALNNFLANVGWSFGEDREIFTIEEAIPRFTLEAINPAPSRLPYDKLDWLNGQYIQQMEPLDLAKAVKQFLDAAGYEVNAEALLAVMPAMRVRMKRLTDAIDFLRFLFDERPLSLTADSLTHKQLPREAAIAAFAATREFLTTAQPYDLVTISQGLNDIAPHHTLNGKPGPFLGTLRLAITGQQVSPPVFESILALGRERSLARLDEVINLFEEEKKERLEIGD